MSRNGKKRFQSVIANRFSGRLLRSRGLVVSLMLLGVAAIGAVMLAGFAVRDDLIAPDPAVMTIDPRTVDRAVLERDIRQLVAGHPIEQMAPYIAREDRMVAAYLVSIAKKESDWGVHVPVGADGRDCYNYWGYRGLSDEMGTGGHTCFDSPREAVATVGGRIHELVYDEHRDTPAKMIVWKCGYSCESHSPESVAKWKNDVGYYFKKFIP